MDQERNSLFHIKQQFAHCWFVLANWQREREWRMDWEGEFSSFYVTNKEINKSLLALTGGGKAGHLSLSIYEVVASAPALLLPLKYLNMCVCGEHRSTGLQREEQLREREWKREMVDIQACWTACGFFLQGSLTHITHFTHMGRCRLNAPLSSAQVFKGCGTYCCDLSLCIWPQGGGEKPHSQQCQAEFLEGCVVIPHWSLSLWGKGLLKWLSERIESITVFYNH